MKLAIYGYDSVIGQSVVEGLENSDIAIEQLYPLSPLAAEYDAVRLKGKNHRIQYVDEFDFAQADIALLLVTKDESERLIPRIQSSKCLIIDSSHYFSGKEKMPIVMKAINGGDMAKVYAKRFAQVPYSATVEIASALAPLHDAFGISRAVVTCLEPLSIHGELGPQTLARETALLLNGSSIDVVDFPGQVAFNVHTHIGNMNDDGVSTYEQGVLDEVNTILDPFERGLSLTCVQVPVFYGQCANFHVQLLEDPSLDELKEEIANDDNLKLVEGDQFVTPVSCAEMDSQIYITRIRKTARSCFDFSVVMDNTRQGEAHYILSILQNLDIDKLRSER